MSRVTVIAPRRRFASSRSDLVLLSSEAGSSDAQTR